jgi:hypothetical protein
MKNQVLYLIFLFIIPVFASSQQFILQGTVVNSETDFPVENVNLKVLNTVFGTATNKDGRFEVVVPILPAVIEVTCIGFEPLSIEITKFISTLVKISLYPAVHQLEGITISGEKAIPVYEDPDYSVLDYEIMNDNLLLLVFRYQLKRCELMLLTRWGDTLAQTDLPDLPPSKLYKDPLGNVHYFSKKGNAYQCYYDKSVKKLSFIYKYSVDTLLATFGNIKFSMNKRLFFQENSPDGFSTQIGYFDNKNGKNYLHLADNSKLAKDYYADLNFFLKPRRPDDIFLSEAYLQAFELFYKPGINARMVKTGPDRIAVFDFTLDTLHLLNSEWKILSTSAISFHKEIKLNLMTSIAYAFSGNQWKWRENMYVDDFAGKVYTCFEKQGRTKLCDIDLYTGKIAAEYEVPVKFVKKIIIYKGEAFFRYKKIGETEKWRLYKMKL